MCCAWTGVLCWVEWRKSIAKIRLSTKNRSLSHSIAVVSSCFVETSKNWIRITPAEINIDSIRPFYSPNQTRIFVVTAHLSFHLEQHFSTSPFSHNVSVLFTAGRLSETLAAGVLVVQIPSFRLTWTAEIFTSSDCFIVMSKTQTYNTSSISRNFMRYQWQVMNWLRN